MWPQGLELRLNGSPSSIPYLDMTLSMLCHFSAHAMRQSNTIIVKPQPYEKQPFVIEPDWSAASYWYEMAAFSEECEIRLKGLGGSSTSLQGDTIIAEWMSQLGVGTFAEGEDVVAGDGEARPGQHRVVERRASLYAPRKHLDRRVRAGAQVKGRLLDFVFHFPLSFLNIGKSAATPHAAVAVTMEARTKSP